MQVFYRNTQASQKNIDEILARETSLDDVDTKPGMMRILAKRVNEVEKEMAKENRKNTDEADSDRSMTKGEMKKREKIVKGMKKNKAGFKKRYGKDAEAVMYATATKNAMKDDEQMEEGLKDWAKKTAMAGIIIAGLAGVGSIQDAIDSSVPAVQAMEKALEMAQDQGNDELAQMIEKDLSAVKVRLSSGKDLNFVKGMQDKYSKFLVKEYRIERPMSDKEERMKALQDIQMDPNTSKDKELMAKLAKELKKLRTQKDSKSKQGYKYSMTKKQRHYG